MLVLEPVEDPAALATIVSQVFADPGTRQGMGWTSEDDEAEALEAIDGLWTSRAERGWRLYAVLLDD